MSEDPARALLSDLTISVRNEISGFVYDPRTLSERFVVELLADGLPIGLYRADGYVEALGKSEIGDGCYGFTTVLTDAVAFGAGTIDARLANSGEAVGTVLRPASVRTRQEGSHRSHVHWVAGLRFEGWLEEGSAQAQRHVKALVDGRVLVEMQPDGWTQIKRGDGFVVGRTFVIDLPATYADGKAHEAEFLAADGSVVAGSPCAFVAFEDGLEGLVDLHAEVESERMRARTLDRLLPQAWPLTEVEPWQSRFPHPRPDEASGPAVAVVIVGESGVEATLASLKTQGGCDWTAACLPDQGRASRFEPDDLLDFIEGDAASSEIVIFCLGGTRFAVSALGLFRDALATMPSAKSAYCDLLMSSGTAEGVTWPLAFSAFDYERCLEQGYCGLVFAMRRAAVIEGARAGAATLIRLFQVQLDRPLEPGEEPMHIPLLLASPPPADGSALRAALAEADEAHFRAKHLTARLAVSDETGWPRVHVMRTPEPGKVSIIIPTRNRAELLTACLTSIDATLGEDTECEVLIADNGSTDKATLAVMASAERQGIKIVRVPGVFNYSRINNLAVAAATGRYLLLLNNDVEALEPGWLEEMLGRIAEPDVGAVGPLLTWPSGIVQHAGIVLGPNFAAAYAFGDRMAGDPGYGGLLQVAHECSAVTGACLLTRRDLYLAQGGLDESRFAIDFNDVDYCLKLRAAGYRIVLTPHAKLQHAESSTRGRYERPDQKDRYGRELANLRLKWGKTLAADPYYNPSLTLAGPPYSGLAWPPRGAEPRQPQGRSGQDLPPGV